MVLHIINTWLTKFQITKEYLIMAKNLQNALNLLEEAEKMLSTPDTFLGGLFGKQPKQYEALQRYGQASVLFKQQHMWSEAGNIFVKMAQF